MDSDVNIIITFIGLFLTILVCWINIYFGLITIDQIYSIILFNFSSLINVNVSLSISFFICCIFIPLIITFLIHKLLVSSYFSILFLILGVMLVNYEFRVIKYINNQFHHTDFYSKNYIDPHHINISAKNPKSLLLIYVESLETTYSNTQIFNNDLLYSLTHLNINNISFSQYEEMPGTNWSIAGIIATQCAVPIKLDYSLTKRIFSENTAHVLSNAECLGDILAKKGYRNIYMNGSRLSFEGFGPFFKDHHYIELYGREKWLRSGILNRTQLTSWGLPDDMLLMLAKLRLNQLIKDKHLFNLTLFLIDTHGISGQLSKTCAEAGYTDFQGIVECTANQVADLVYYIKKNGWLEQMNVVIVGDHLAMQNMVSDKLSTVKKRYIFNMIVSNSIFYKNTDKIVPFDMLPTILTSLGFQYQGNRLGLGYSAIGLENKYRPKNRIKILADDLLYGSKYYNALWKNIENE